ncbi:TPA: hypothetical protein DDZ49_01495 [Candidatus Wolfebacteria bacterium]|uniref:Uncharacterized protein n=2 Tax=Candidatus Wolfeibacteriota TaxID=1752735 RepID=A0A0G1U6D4_9BACT|nr:MAG: hypothetical protein UX70_C0001G0782 [Candidatus Wolfebacteria bacterium GW2011_GWB1_47_1]KKU42295.1 MAG: hypothetical protein UX58_C0002G0009 [Candidatus Wolfebacteria bacterium GW2011_GWB2_46_69]KKU53699.1 MAG: hypothetical protein UX76_C0011G0044 [Candidatus Wolfebacteria bacterium GW2011_GWC1_47_103]KKU58944.1 MAG: hypothetical protein UX83_C0010G0066 [Candidatus Wolfebacteria bacterium GW2011_GWE2_47_12]KKU66092.1 MAG: hypothetical protein UX90_C0001G0151 [Candidatus Wolfebacteria 
MTKEIEQQRRIVELERLNGELAKQVVEAEQRAAGIYEQYQVLRYVIENSPTQHDLLFLKGRIKLLEETLDKEVSGWRFKIGKKYQEGKGDEGCQQSKK